MFNDKIEIEAKVEHQETTPNDVARRIAFILLKAARKAKQDQPTEDKEQKE
jgi:hypothetical protein